MILDPVTSDRYHGWRAGVEGDFIGRGVKLYLGQNAGSDVLTRIAAPAELTIQTVEEPAVAVEPFLRLPEDCALALLDGLAAYYGGHSDLRALRADYHAERARVDKLIDRIVPALTVPR